MAYWAKIDDNNTVIEVVVANKYWRDNQDDFDMYIQCKPDQKFRKNFPGLGFTYDATRDAFIPPRPEFASWTLNEETCQWQSPVPHPKTINSNDSKSYSWNESSQSWVENT